MTQIVSIQAALPREVSAAEAPDPGGNAWRTGFFKTDVAGPAMLRRLNLDGDGQGDLKNHGGPDKAVLCYALTHYPRWRDELQKPDLPHGAFGENFTIDDLDETNVCIGDVYTVGGAVVQVSQPRQPCWKIAARWRMPDLLDRVLNSGRTGWYVRVLQEGVVQAGDALQLVERPNPAWSVARATDVIRAPRDLDGARGLLGCSALAESWRIGLEARLARVAG